MKSFRLAPISWILLLAWIPSLALPLAPKEAEETFRQANALFRQAGEEATRDPVAARDLYARAALRFERLVSEGGVRNGLLYYNLGNTYFRMGDLGRSILNYRRALMFIPADFDLQRNLEYVRSRRPDRIAEGQPRLVLKTLFFWHYDIPLAWKRFLLAFFSAAFWTLAALWVWSRRRSLAWALAVTGGFAALWLGSLAVDQWSLLRDRSGVVLAPEVTARKGDGMTYEPAFQEPLRAGTEFALQERRPGWWKVSLADGRTCWLPEGSAELVRPAGGERR